MHELILRGIDSRWRSLLRKADSRVLAFFPYLTGPTALSVLRNVQPSRCEVHTVCSLENFVTGASSLAVLKTLLQDGFHLFHLDRLHAKVIIVSGQAATVGSQNLTSFGRNNLEASVCFSSPSVADSLEASVSQWIACRRQIRLTDIAEIEACMLPLRREFNRLGKKIQTAESSIRASREKRDATLQEVIQMGNLARERLSALASKQSIPREMASDFIKASAFWDHPKAGYMVRSPGDARHVKMSDQGWILDRGNKLLIEKAIQRCARLSLDAVTKLLSGEVVHLETLRAQLGDAIRSSVARYDGKEYNGFYSESLYSIPLGSHSIDVIEFRAEFERRFDLAKVMTKLVESRSEK
jgi:hypothetical protein